jgi:hypothetical protein
VLWNRSIHLDERLAASRFRPICIKALIAGCYRNGRIFPAGDAGEQGMQTSIGDAYNLGWKLASVLDGALDALLDTYQAERLPIAQSILATSSARHREWLSASVQAITTVFSEQDSFSDLSQLSLIYRGSKLSRDLDETMRLRAGDRAPDAPCIHASNGEPVRLFDLFRGTHFGPMLARKTNADGKKTGETVHVERWNNMPRQRLACFVRKTLSSPNLW